MGTTVEQFVRDLSEEAREPDGAEECAWLRELDQEACDRHRAHVHVKSAAPEEGVAMD